PRPVGLKPLTALLVAAAAAVAACHGSSAGPEYPRDRKLRLNDVQVRGTHNSYHPPLPPPERQLDEGMRQLELDVFGDPSGRFFAVLIGDMADASARGGTSLRGRAMFVYASSGPLAAVTSRPDARTAGDEIVAFVRSGLIVRTQADEGPPDEARRSAAVASGA